VHLAKKATINVGHYQGEATINVAHYQPSWEAVKPFESLHFVPKSKRVHCQVDYAEQNIACFDTIIDNNDLYEATAEEDYHPDHCCLFWFGELHVAVAQMLFELF
jgi:hypothetical protein